jgi:DNA-binding IclR family transcriptional regulator
VLRALAHLSPVPQGGLEGGLPVEEIAHQAGLAPEKVKRALETLARHDVVMEAEGRWQFTVELMRRWVRDKKPGF